MSRGPEEVNRLTENTYRVSVGLCGARDEKGGPGPCGSRLRAEAGRPTDLGFEARNVSPAKQLTIVASRVGRDSFSLLR